MKFPAFTPGLIAAGMLAAPLLASANSLPVATGGESIAYPALEQSGFGTLTWYEVPGASATALPGFASANTGGNQAEESADSYYYFEIVGPVTQVPVVATVDIAATAATTSGAGTAQAYVSVLGSYVAFSCSGECGTTGPPPVTHTFSDEVNQPIEVVLSAYASSGAATALADPYITIDPSTPDAQLYSIEVSDGVSNTPTSPVPLPAPAVLLLGGLGGLVVLMHQRRRAPVGVTATA